MGLACVMTFNATDPSGAGGLRGRHRHHRRHGRPRAARGHRHRAARHRRGVRPQRDRRRRRRRAGPQHPGGCHHLRLEGGVPRFAGGCQRRGRGALRLPGRARWWPTCPTCRGSRKTSSRPTSTPTANCVLPQAEVLVGSHQTLTDFLLPEWNNDRPASPRELGGGRGRTRHALRAREQRARRPTSSSTTCWPRRRAPSPGRSSNASR